MNKNLLPGSELCAEASKPLPTTNDASEELELIPHRLGELEEARGDLLSIFCRNGFAVATFPWGVITFPAELEVQLRSVVGHKCAVLRLDGIYHVREV